MIILASPAHVANPSVLEISSAPRRFLGRGFGVIPRGTVRRRAFWRLVLEFQLLRYLAALIPFPVAMLIWPHLALPISQAPLLMFLLVYLVESRVLSVPKDKRAGLVDENTKARTLDAFRLRATDCLTRILAGRGLPEGEVHLVVEQSELARVAPLTIISLQTGGPGSEVLALDDREAAEVMDGLFAEGLTEVGLLQANQSDNVFLRHVTVDAASISAHARLEALARRRA